MPNCMVAPSGINVSDKSCNLFHNIRVAIFGHRHFRDGIVDRDNVIQAADVDERIAECARHLLIDFRNDDLGRFCR